MQCKDDRDRHRDDHKESAARTIQILKLASPRDLVSGRKLDLPLQSALGVRDESSLVPAHDIGSDRDGALIVAPGNNAGAICDPDIG